MNFSNDQNDNVLPVGSNSKKTSVDFLPKYFKTATNKKFLSSTIDQLIDEGSVDKLNAFIGRKTAKAYNPSDSYLEDVSANREAYQLEPALVIKDNLNNVTFFKNYNDYINQLSFFNGEVSDHNKLNRQEYYSWNPHIDWDKFVNYREYYWLPSGPQPVPVAGQADTIVSTYTVKVVDDGDNQSYVFTPNGLTKNPTLRLYRGQTYRFEIDCPGHPIAFSTTRSFLPSQTLMIATETGVQTGGIFDVKTFDTVAYDLGGWTYSTIKAQVDSGPFNVYDIWTEGVVTDPIAVLYVEKGTIEFTIPEEAPNVLYYVSKNSINTSGLFKIYDITEATSINVETEIIGKKTYTSSNGVDFSNGTKVYFTGRVTPDKYDTGYWYVEGVGSKIELISEKDLELPAPFTTTEQIEFDNEKFDEQGFDVNNNFPGTKDYLLINRASKDRNPWSRYNRWFHRSVVESSAAFNGQDYSIDQQFRAKRPIIEFNQGLTLWNFGRQAKRNVDLIDTFTKDVFSTIEGGQGYSIDGVPLIEGIRIIFAADTDIRVNGRIYTVKFHRHLNVTRLALIPTEDSEPIVGETVLVMQGNTHRGSMFHYTSNGWVLGQVKNSPNQVPLFDVVDSNGYSYGDTSIYQSTTFAGTKLFSYRPGTNYDTELGFNISYKNIGNVGDILFDFNLHSDVFTHQHSNSLEKVNITLDNGYLLVHDGFNSLEQANGWTTTFVKSRQFVVRQYDITTINNFLPIDVYERSGTLTDLEVKVLLNEVEQKITDYEIFVQNDIAYVQFFTDLTEGDVVLIKTISNAKKTEVGFYEFPVNLENNPQNLSMDNFTLGEIINHAQSISSNIVGFTGSTPGLSNLRDLGDVNKYGTRIVQHSGPLAPAIYHITNKDYNVINSLRYARQEYSKFKRQLLRTADSLGYDGITRIHLDLVLQEAVKDYTKQMPYYLSDMIPMGASFIFEQTVIDDSITAYPLIFDFSLSTLSEKAVLIYLNDKQLLVNTDYTFINDSFVNIITPLVTGDNVKVVQYEKTDGCFIPPTPTKLGLYPKYTPSIFVDNTYQTLTKVIQGHDGSITVAFNDFRDDLLLEFETRIYNNIKVQYDSNVFNITDYISGYYRTGDISVSDFNAATRQDFLNWLPLVNADYTKHDFFNRNNDFTFNHAAFTGADGTTLIPGFWRGIYKFVYDTDRPHTHPWEMLGFTEQPAWWVETYGPLPYTRDNLVMWNDIAEGLIKVPGKLPIRNLQYARPSILEHLPVDDQGKLVSPVLSNFVRNFVATLTNEQFEFGDYSPVESAWRKSSEYPFSLITALTILRPAAVFSAYFDRSRQHRDQTGQLVYKLDEGNLRFNTSNLVFPSVSSDTVRSFTSGLVNYVVDYTISKSLTSVNDYKNNIKNLKVNLSSNLGGFVSKEKFRLILDSRNPTNKTSVFVPQESYNIILNTSSPILSISYSGVIIEKLESGFTVRGYNKTIPEFKYFKPIVTISDPVINVGGISESFVDWSPEKYYNKNQIVRHDNSFYRTDTVHTSSAVFEIKYFVKLPALPIVGGRDITLRKNFNNDISYISYGTELASIQSVVDFILGYGHYLEQQGFKFNFFNPQLSTIINWATSAKEFAFWTTQNWAVNSIITLSPAADELYFEKEYAVVDNIYDNFYDYSLLKQDGEPLPPEFVNNNLRNKNTFNIRPALTSSDGIYHVTLNLVQKEHVLIIDDSTIFNDTIYDQKQGYRQERIKVIGYRTSGWDGSFDAPGFIYDEASVLDWTPWTDYQLGQSVKYKEFYYSAINLVSGSEEFNFNEWIKLSARPTTKLIPNFDYKARQFADFYDLDTDSFDTEQQKFAQHLIGYQKRSYLENIINDDVSQYKFYQGMIQEKGTKNSFSKLFDALSSADKDSLEFYEEWAIRLGQYGATAAFEEVEYKLDEQQFLINPQPIELVNSINVDSYDFVYRILPNEVYVKPDEYTHSPLPTMSEYSEVIKTPGYARVDDVQYTLTSLDEIVDFDIFTLRDGDYFWVSSENISWNIYRFTAIKINVTNVELVSNNLKITFSREIQSLAGIDKFVGFTNTIPALEKIYKVVDIGYNFIVIEKSTEAELDDLDSTDIPMIRVYGFTSQRLTNISNFNNLPLSRKKEGELIWIDGDTPSSWQVIRYSRNYSYKSLTRSSATNFGRVIAASDNNKFIAVTTDTDRVLCYTRDITTADWRIVSSLFPDSSDNFQTNNSYGDSLAFLNNGVKLLVGIPSASDDMYTNSGRIAVYDLSSSGLYIKSGYIFANNQTNLEFFGDKIVTSSKYTAVTSRGSASVEASVYLYSATTNSYITKHTAQLGINIISVAISDLVLVISFSDYTVKAFSIINNSLVLIEKTFNITEVPEYTGTNVSSNFGASVAITTDSKFIAVGAPLFIRNNNSTGAVILYALDEVYTVSDIIYSNVNNEIGQFGYKVLFNNSNDQLIVYSKTGNQTYDTTYDNNTTSFDLRTTWFTEIVEFVGSIKVFDLYNDKFIFAEELEVNPVVGKNYGADFIVTDRVYITDTASVNGTVHEFYSPSKAWALYRTSDNVVDLKKIKSVFLYNTVTNSVIKNLDWVDPIRGKILGIADQEISFKTPYDPATYAIGDDDVNVDSLMFWKSENVGRIWWDLSSTRYVNSYQGSVLHKANSWNTLYNTGTVKVYEWVETEYMPDEWDELADTEAGLSMNISGQSKYGNAVYSVKQTYDTISKKFKNLYYFWVENKAVVPAVDFRKISARDIAGYIADPKSKGSQYITLLSSNQFALVNCKPLIADKDIALNIRYWVVDNIDLNVHSHYQLLAEGDPSKKLNKFIEQKWFDSLIGYDELGNDVPDSLLSAKLKYGILSKPRQSMFINRLEALKQIIERVNSILIKNLIADESNFEILNSRDSEPSPVSNLYDTTVSNYSQLRFIGTAKISRAQISLSVVDGRITRATVINPGSGYLVSPTITVIGAGKGAKLTAVLNESGGINSVLVENSGEGYNQFTSATVRYFTALVLSDETSSNKWALYTWTSSRVWFKAKTQTFDTTKFWEYVDWYDSGYNLFTKIDHVVDFAYQIPSLIVNLGETVKINSHRGQGWILLEKINTTQTTETTVNYKTIARQNGTIQFKDNLYRFSTSNAGFDGPSFDATIFDDQPKQELRNILICIRDNLLVDDLAAEYNKLFFASLRYIFSEQLFVDWAFKTSFVKSKHNLGELEQKVTYQNDNLESYEDYINEVKPYRSKIREFVSNFSRLEQARSIVTDFDLPARYDFDQQTIKPFITVVNGPTIDFDSADILLDPYRNWLDNVGYNVTEIIIVNKGVGYKRPPVVEIVGACTVPAKAIAYVAKGAITKILVTDPGSGYLTTPTVIITGSVGVNGTPAYAIPILGDGLVRSTKVGMKFDRLSPTYTVNNITVTQTFSGTGSRTRFELKWPIDVKTNNVSVVVSREELLISDFKVSNEKDKTSSYTRYNGILILTTAPSPVDTITITYRKSIELLDAADRIQYFYSPVSGMLGNELGQLMVGVDYGGVQIEGMNFDIGAGWDATPWMYTGWASFDSTYTDYLVKSDGQTRSITLPFVPSDGELINIYLNGERLDPAQMPTFVGDGVTSTVSIPLGVTIANDDTFILRKNTSDGSFRPDSRFYDSEISGGDLAYTSAKGITPAEINIDGDGFVTPNTSHAPEELLPGQIVDTLDMHVYHKVSDGAPVIVTKFYLADGLTTTFNVGQFANTIDSIFVSIDGILKVKTDDYTIDYANKSITFFSIPDVGSKILVTSFSQHGKNILDLDNFVGDGISTEFITSARWEGDYSVFVTLNGLAIGFTTFRTTETYPTVNNIGIRFNDPPAEGAVISYTVMSGNVSTVSDAKTETITYIEGTTNYAIQNIPMNIGPIDNNVIVEAAGRILRPADTVYFKVEGNLRTYSVSIADYPINTIEVSEITVLLNGAPLVLSRDYTWNTALNQLRIKKNVAVAGDLISMTISKGADYKLNSDGLSASIDLYGEYSSGTLILITTFTTHDILEIQRSNDSVVARSTLEAGTIDYYTYNKLTAGRIKLNELAIGSQYVWVTKNKEILSPEIDYILEDNLEYIRLSSTIEITDADVIEVIVFSSKVKKESVGYRIFKDMNNKTVYKRIDDTVSTELAQPLRPSDTTITVKNSSGLMDPGQLKNKPGVLLIEGERIEYYKKKGNILTQLRRGTLGTGVKDLYTTDTLVRDQSDKQTVPYKDETLVDITISDGFEKFINISFVPKINEKTTSGEIEWFRQTIPDQYGQCDEIEVFINGRRLHKHPIIVWNEANGPYSPLGDTEYEAEFSVNGVNAQVRLTVAAPLGATIRVVKKLGRVWTDAGVGLIDGESDAATFIRATTAMVPDKLLNKYNNAAGLVSAIELDNGSGTLDNDDGNAIEWI